MVCMNSVGFAANDRSPWIVPLYTSSITKTALSLKTRNLNYKFAVARLNNR